MLVHPALSFFMVSKKTDYGGPIPLKMASANSTNTPNKPEMTTTQLYDKICDPNQTTVDEFFAEITDSKSQLYGVEFVDAIDSVDVSILNMIRELLSGRGNNSRNREVILDVFIGLVDEIYHRRENARAADLFIREHRRFCIEQSVISFNMFVKGGLESNSDSAIHQSFFDEWLFERLTIPTIFKYIGSLQQVSANFVFDIG
jgi:hypothetical protein